MITQLLCKVSQFMMVRTGEFLFPPLCIICDKPYGKQSTWLCDDCINTLKHNFSSRNACTRCAQNKTIRSCSCESVWDFKFDQITSLFDYDDLVRKMMQLIKYRGKNKLAKEVGRLFADSLKPYLATFDIVVPVPLHKKRLRQRGYNQSEAFAKGILCDKTSVVGLQNVLYRTRNTKSQTGFDKEVRKLNLKNAFAVRDSMKAFICDKKILLVDDVVTTGSTADSCAGALLLSGCHSVSLLSIARD